MSQKKKFVRDFHYFIVNQNSTNENFIENFTEQKQSAKFTNEIREIRIREGNKAKFEASFAGNPPPKFTWQVCTITSQN